MQSPTASEHFRCPTSSARRPHSGRRGLTVLEILVAATLALVMILAMIQIFAVVGSTVTTARSTLEMSGQLRLAAHRLHLDLQGLTLPVRPWVAPSEGLGYFEYVERPGRDGDADGNGTPDVSQVNANGQFTADDPVGLSVGDMDDILMFTARSTGEPFVGRFAGAMIESPVAEIVWWTVFTDVDGDNTWDPGEITTLHRRVLLIRPDLDLSAFPPNLTAFYQDNDVSARVVGGTLVANSLGDLTRRENRFAHRPTVPGDFPHPIDISVLTSRILAGPRLGEDVILSNIVAFDVRAYDPTAPVRVHPGPDGAWGQAGVDDDGNGTPDDLPEAGFGGSDDVPLVPGDPGYATATAVLGAGTFVDLNYAGTTGSTFSGPPTTQSGLASLPTYCTWSLHYEHDGYDQDGDGLTDEGTDGIDNDNANGVDDVGERETAPPYPVPLRGIKVTLRVLEVDSQQVRQTSVVSDFKPE